MLRRWILAVALLAGASTPALAQLPSTVAPDLYAFPGAHTAPGSAASAALALADRFLGNEPFANPAGTRDRTLMLGMALLRVSRQDLRADNRRFDEQPVFFDAAGGWFGFERGALGLALYGYQPVLRLEDNAFNRGIQSGPPLTVQSNTTAREMRLGAAVSWALGRARIGAAPEWTYRSDHYERHETGGPGPEQWTADWNGSGVGGHAGVRLRLGPEGRNGITLGCAARYVPELTLEGDELLDLVAGPDSNRIETRRDAGWEGGAGAMVAATEALHVMASADFRTAQAYERFGVTRGSGAGWGVAAEFHDRRDPWTVRFGLGEEHERGVAEPRAGRVGLGFAWMLESTSLEFGVVRYHIGRLGHPSSSEDHVTIGIVQRFEGAAPPVAPGP